MRIVVVGATGTVKTTLAAEFQLSCSCRISNSMQSTGNRNGATRRRDAEEFVRRLTEAIQAEAWVVDDNCRMPSWRRGRRSGRSAVRSRQIPGHHERFSGSRRHVELTCSNSWRKSTAGLSR